MLTSSRIRSVIQKIIDYHGRCEEISIYDSLPINEEQSPTKSKKKAKKDEEKEEADEEEKKGPAKDEEKELPKYRTFDNHSTTLFEIFGEYGCELKS